MDLVELEKRTNVKFPKEQLEDIFYHASFQPQDSKLLKRNKEYIYWGHSIIDTAYSAYLYVNEDQLSAEDLTTKSNKAYKYIEDAVYEKFDLEEYVIKSNGEIGLRHPDIATKLIVLIYQLYGFAKVYEFLLPFFDTFDDSASVDYKTLLQEYAQARKLSPVYEVIRTDGPDHEKKVVCKVTVGKQTTTGEAIGKKNAQKEVAKQFSLKYKIRAEKKNPKERLTFKSQAHSLSVLRQKDLETAVKILRLSGRYISYHQMDEVLTHSSYANEHQKQGRRSNACVTVVGANVLSMLCSEYVFENYDTSQVSVVQEKGVLLQEDNLSKAVPDGITKYLLKSSAVENNRTQSRLKVDVLKSSIGILWLNYITKRDKAISEFVKDYAFTILLKSSKDKILDFRTFLQEVTQKYKWHYSNDCEQQTYNADNSTVFVATITIRGDGWNESGTGAGGSKTAATNAAAKGVLEDILPHCSEDKNMEAAILRMLDPELLCTYEAKKNKEPKKKSVKEDYPQVPSPNKIRPNEKKTKERLLDKKDEIPKEVSFDGVEHVLYVCKGTIVCRKNGHEVVSATGILASLSGRPVKININYCKSCKVFFIGLSEYKYYQNIYGALLGNISIRQSVEFAGYGYDSLAEESILHMCGYTVNQADNLSADQRRRILGNLMDRDIVSKYRIIEYLQFFINSSKYRYNMRLANQKWSDDLIWTRTYNIDSQRKYVITTTKKWY